MNLGRTSVKRIFLLASGGMAVSMLAISAVLFAVTGQTWILASGMLLTLCALAWMFFLSIAFSKRLSVFTRELCRAMDRMIIGILHYAPYKIAHGRGTFQAVRRRFFAAVCRLKCPRLVTFQPHFLCRLGHFCDIWIL